MLSRLFWIRCLLIVVTIAWIVLPNSPAQAAADLYVAKYLHVSEPIALEYDGKGETKSFSPEELSQGKKLFENNCMNCHVGGATLPAPEVSLSLEKLKGANPPRDNINGLVDYLRHPMIYDGSEEIYWCREVPESWMPKEQVESLAAFILTAAQKAPGWGTDSF